MTYLRTQTITLFTSLLVACCLLPATPSQAATTSKKIILVKITGRIHCNALTPSCKPEAFYQCEKVVIKKNLYLRCDTSKPLSGDDHILQAHTSGWFGKILTNVRNHLGIHHHTGLEKGLMDKCRRRYHNC